MPIMKQESEQNNSKSELNSPRWSRRLHVMLSVLLLVILALVAWRCINYVSGLTPGFDSSIYASHAVHIQGGRIPYIEVWEHKPPMIFVIDMWALAAGDGTINSIRFAERLFAVAGAFL